MILIVWELLLVYTYIAYQFNKTVSGHVYVYQAFPPPTLPCFPLIQTLSPEGEFSQSEIM